jgi:hypothetical protein
VLRVRKAHKVQQEQTARMVQQELPDLQVLHLQEQGLLP